MWCLAVAGARQLLCHLCSFISSWKSALTHCLTSEQAPLPSSAFPSSQQQALLFLQALPVHVMPSRNSVDLATEGTWGVALQCGSRLWVASQCEVCVPLYMEEWDRPRHLLAHLVWRRLCGSSHTHLLHKATCRSISFLL